MFDSIKNKFQFRFKDRTYAANILAAALEDFLGKEIRKESKNSNLMTDRKPVIADHVYIKSQL